MGLTALRLARLVAFAAVLAAPGPAALAQQVQTQSFVAPQVRGVPLDWCAHFGRDCGKPAADLFCREMRFDQATTFSIDQTAGQRGLPTLVFGDGSLCNGPQCSGFRQIVCTRTVAAQAPSRETAPPSILALPPAPAPPPPTLRTAPPTIAQPPPPPRPPVTVQPVRPPTNTTTPPPVIAQPPTPPPPVIAQPVVPIPRGRPELSTVPSPGAPIKPVITPLDPADILKATFGTIYLDAPRVEPDWYGDIHNPRAGEIPFWDDETVFKWHPSNPGMADSYELRFFSTKDGGTPIAAARVPGTQTAKATSIPFVQELLTNAGVPTASQNDLMTVLWAAIGNAQGNMFWEVAGYRGYQSSGVAKDAGGGGETMEAQVAVSERWPLRAPQRAHGYGACGPNSAPEINAGAFEFFNIDAGAAKRPAGIDYVYDLVEVQGSFSLAFSPYAAHPKQIMAPPKPGQQINIDVAGFQFDNVFIDWGDGTVEPLNVASLDHSQWNRADNLGLPGQPPTQHRYASAGSYWIRIFQVSEQDVQKVNVALLNLAVQTEANKQGGGTGKAPYQAGNYYQALASGQPVIPGGSGPSGPVLSAQAQPIEPLLGGFPLEVANRAYVVYCHQVTPTEPMDEKAFGDLVFYDGDILFDDSHANDKSNPIAATVAACDESAKARGRFTYVGKGTATLTWKVDGAMVGGVTEQEIGPSPPRSGEEIHNDAPPKQGTWFSDWVPLPVSEAMKGGHQVTAEIVVKETGQKLVRYLRPTREAAPASPAVIQIVAILINTDLQSGTLPKKQLIAGPRTYTVADNAPGKPCHLRFLVAGGAFDVFVPDATKITAGPGGMLSGEGNLLVPFANQGQELTVPLTFSGWQVSGNGDVTAGTLAVDGIANGTVNLPGLSVAVKALAGKAGASDGAVAATIDVAAEGGGLRKADGSPAPPKWSGEAATLAPDGDWFKATAKTGLRQSLIGWSGFLIDSDLVALDFSAKEGMGPGGDCGAATADWIGARLDTAKVSPNLFSLDAVHLPVSGWVVGAAAAGNGLCGDIDAVEPVPQRPVGEGFIAIHKLTASVRAGFLKGATYNMDIGVPILGVTLKGTGTLVQKSGQEPSWNLSGLQAPAADLQLGTVRLQASGYQAGTDANGWRVEADTKLTLAAEGKTLATVSANAVRYGLDGRVRFDDAGATARTIGLSGGSVLGATPVVLKSATLSGPTTGATRLGIAVATSIHLSDTLPSPDVDVGYAVAKTGNSVTASGPTSSPFELKVAFPAADPGVKASIKPQYVGNANAGGAQSAIKFYAGPGNAVVDLLGSGSPVQSSFVLGTVGSSDYWMTLTSVSLGPSGSPLAPPILNLFGVSGGLGYHVQTDKFVGLGDVKAIPPNAGTGMTFLAGFSAGTPDQVTLTVDGQLKMTETDKVRMDFTAWLLRAKSGSTGDFTGFIQYGGGSLDGQIWGGLSLLEGAVKASAPQGAVDMHFGSGGPWHIYLGRREGPKISTTLLNLGGTTGYLMLSEEGYFVGSGASINLGGKVGPFSAKVSGWLDAELGIEPLIPRVSGTASGGLSVKGCAFGVCVGPDATVKVKMAALPINVSAKACFEVDLYFKTVGACGSVSL